MKKTKLLLSNQLTIADWLVLLRILDGALENYAYCSNDERSLELEKLQRKVKAIIEQQEEILRKR